MLKHKKNYSILKTSVSDWDIGKSPNISTLHNANYSFLITMILMQYCQQQKHRSHNVTVTAE